MLFIFSIRSLSFLLVCLLITNIASLLAAPFYYFPARSELLKRAATQITLAGNVEVESADPTEGLSLLGSMQNDSPDIEHAKEQSGTDLMDSTADPNKPASQNIPNPGQAPWLEARFHLKESAERILHAMGEGLAKNPVRLSQTIAQTAKYFTPDAIPTTEGQEAPEIQTERTEQTLPIADSSNIDSSENQVILINPKSNRLEVAFLLDGEVHTLAPGTELIPKKSDVTIHFDRGGGHGLFQKQLPAGKYRFSVSVAGWTLEPMQAVD